MTNSTSHRSGPTARQRAGPLAAAWLGAFGAIGALTFLGNLLVVHLADSGPSPITDYVSDYANGPLGGAFTAGLIAHALGNAALALGIWLTVSPSTRGSWGAILLGLAAAGLLVAGVYPTDAPGAASTTAGTVHRGAAMVSFPVEVLSLTLLATAFGQSHRWRGYVRQTVVIAILATVALLWLVVAVRVGSPSGLAERAALLALLVWELSTSLRLAARPDRDHLKGLGVEADRTCSAGR